ncbi:KH domain-containing protein [bacterium]|nr:KH domain-containing protein [bacterium]
MKEFVAYIVKNLVDNPDKVNIKEIGGTQTLIIELSVEKSDIGKIIGKRGKTINAIRTLLMSVASRNGLRVNLEILEEDSEEEESAEVETQEEVKAADTAE